MYSRRVISMSERIDAVDTGSDRSAIDSALGRLCTQIPSELPRPVTDAMRYACRGSGKRLRGILVVASYRAARGSLATSVGPSDSDFSDAFLLAAAVEMLHAYSLAHDDLPCMDDDDMRRGRAATHRMHGVAVTMVAGVALIPFVAAVLARATLAGSFGRSEPTGRAIIVEVMAAVGASGMIGGQLADLAAESAPVGSLDALDRIHRMKTGALIAACCRAGGLAAGASNASVAALGDYGNDIGLAFQIVDDVLDVTATTAQLGKTTGRDLALGKSTYPGLLGVDGAMARAHHLVHQGCGALERAGLLTPELRHLADLFITRTH